MAQSKKRTARGGGTAREKASPKQTDGGFISKLFRHREPGDTRFTVRDYLTMNLIFDAFCFVQLIIVRVLLRDFAGLYFFFGFLMCAFLIASVFDYFSEKLNMGVSPEEKI